MAADHLRVPARRGDRRGCSRQAGPRGHEPARQRRQVQPAGRSRGGRAARPGADDPRPRPGNSGRGRRARLRPLLPRRFGARAPGSGLGLAIVRQVADAHGATVTAEAPEGGGTAMRMRFPAERGT
ncbi:ATP-binding protein [Saccharopolyspora spinosporotrichia]